MDLSQSEVGQMKHWEKNHDIQTENWSYALQVQIYGPWWGWNPCPLKLAVSPPDQNVQALANWGSGCHHCKTKHGEDDHEMLQSNMMGRTMKSFTASV